MPPPAVGFQRFLDDVQEMTIPMLSLDWRETPTVPKLKRSPISPLSANMPPAGGFRRFLDDVQKMTIPMLSLDWRETPAVPKRKLSPITVLLDTEPRPLIAGQLDRSDTINADRGDAEVGQGIVDDNLSKSGDDAAVKRNLSPITVLLDTEPRPLAGQLDRSDIVSADRGDAEVGQGTMDDNLSKSGDDAAVMLKLSPITVLFDTAPQPAEKDDATMRNTHQLIEDLENQNKELMQEKQDAVKWQDEASMAIKEAKDDVEVRKQETKAAKKARLRAAAASQRQLDETKGQIKALKRHNKTLAEEKASAEVAHRDEMSAAEGKIEDLQTQLDAANDTDRDTMATIEEISKLSHEMEVESAAKDQKLAAQEREKEALQDRLDLRDAEIEDVKDEAARNREACNKYCREKFESAKAQQDAESKVTDLKWEADTVKADTEKAMNALQTKLDESVLREKNANARAVNAGGDAEQLKRDLDNTELARQSFEKKEEKWATLFAARQASAEKPSRSQSTALSAAISETEQNIPTTTASEVEISKPAEESVENSSETSKKPEQQVPDSHPNSQGRVGELKALVRDWERAWKDAEKGAEDWKRDVRRELKDKYKTALATKKEKLRREMDEEKQKALSDSKAEREAEFRAGYQQHLSGKKVKWEAKHSATLRSQLEAEIRSEIRSEFQAGHQKDVSEKKAEWEVENVATRSQLEAEIRSEIWSEFQAGYQKDVSEKKAEWEVENVATRSQLETEVRNQLRPEYENKFSTYKSVWEADHSPSQTALQSQQDMSSQSRIEVDGPGYGGSAATVSAVDEKLLASLSRESDEMHELFQEIARSGISPDSTANTVLRELNQAKDALYDVKCELRKPVGATTKNNLLYSVDRLHVNEHYIGKLNPTTREVLRRQAGEANRRLEYVQRTLSTNDDVPTEAMLMSLLSPLNTQPEHINIQTPAYSQMANGLGSVVAPGFSTFPTQISGIGNPTFPGNSLPPPTVNGFGDAATPDTSKTTTKGVFNPFANSHFGSQPPLDMQVDSGSASLKPQDDGEIRFDAPGFDLNSLDLGYPTSQVPGLDWNSLGEIVDKAMAGPAITEPQGSTSTESSSAPPESSKDHMAEDHQMDTDSEVLFPQVTRSNPAVAGVGFVSSRQRQAKKTQGQPRGILSKGRQLAHQAFAKSQNASVSTPTQARKAGSQLEVPATQQAGSVGSLPETRFSLEPNHGFGE